MSNASSATVTTTPLAPLAESSDQPASRPSIRLSRRVIGSLAAMVVVQAGMNLLPLVIEIPAVGWAGRWFEWTLFLSLAAATTIVAWLPLSPEALRPRIVVAATALTIMLGTQWLGWLVAEGGIANRVEMVTQLAAMLSAYLLSVGFVAWYFRRVRGWRLVPRGWNEPIPAGRPLRFNLRQVFIGMAVVGLILSIRNDRVPYQLFVVGAIAGLVASVALVPAMTLILAVRSSRMTTLLDVSLLSIAVVAFVVRTVANGWQYDLTIFATAYVWTCVGLAWLRLWGLCLLRGEAATTREIVGGQSPANTALAR